MIEIRINFFEDDEPIQEKLQKSASVRISSEAIQYVAPEILNLFVKDTVEELIKKLKTINSK
jgi:RPA family protein